MHLRQRNGGHLQSLKSTVRRRCKLQDQCWQPPGSPLLPRQVCLSFPGSRSKTVDVGRRALHGREWRLETAGTATNGYKFQHGQRSRSKSERCRRQFQRVCEVRAMWAVVVRVWSPKHVMPASLNVQLTSRLLTIASVCAFQTRQRFLSSHSRQVAV